MKRLLTVLVMVFLLQMTGIQMNHISAEEQTGDSINLVGEDNSQEIDGIYISNKHKEISNIPIGTTAEELINILLTTNKSKTMYIIVDGQKITDNSELLNYRHDLVVEQNESKTTYSLYFFLDIHPNKGQTAIEKYTNNTFYVNEDVTVDEFIKAINLEDSKISSIEVIEWDTQNPVIDSSTVLTINHQITINGNFGYYVAVGGKQKPIEGTNPDNPEDANKNPLGIADVQINFFDLEGNPATGTKSYDYRRRKHIYLPEDTEFKLEVLATDQNGESIDLSNSNIDLINLRGSGTTPLYNPEDMTLTTKVGGGGFKDQFQGILMIDSYQIEVILLVYEGKLGFLRVENPDNSAYKGQANYSIQYKFQNKGTMGSNTDGIVYDDGTLPIPIQSDFIGLDYAYIVLSPDEESEVAIANTPFIDLTDKLSNGQEGEFFYLGVASFQTPNYEGTLLTQSGERWTKSRLSLTGFYTGEAYDIHKVYFMLKNNNGTFFLAPLGSDFDSEMQIEVRELNSDNMPVTKNINVEEDATGTFKSPMVNVKGHFLQPDSQNLISNGYGRDASVIVHGVTDTNFLVRSTVRYTGDYGLTGLIEGDEYWAHAQLGLGDFFDVALTDSIPLRFTYTTKPGTYIAQDQYGNEQTYIVNEDGVMELDLTTTKPVLKGQVYMGNNPVNDLSVRIEDPETGAVIAYGRTSKDNFEYVDGKFLIGGIPPLEGQYTITVEAPLNSIDYTDISFKQKFPVNDPIKIDLPKVNVYGNILISQEDIEKYKNNIRRVYVNIFDVHGDFITNGRVRSDGVFTVGQIPNGKYYAQAFVSAYSTVAEDYMSSEKIPFIMSSSKKVSYFDVPLKKVIGTGIVMDPNGNAMGNIWIRIFDEDMNEVEYVNTDNLGKFFIPELEPGSYKVKAYGQNGYFDSRFKAIEVSENTRDLQVELSLTTPNLSGSVLANDGTVANVDVLLFNQGKEFITFATTKEHGQFALGGLEPGNYYVQVIPRSPIEGYSQTGFIEVKITEGNQSLSINLLASSIKGLVHGPNDERISKGWVLVYKDGSYVTSAKVEADGSFSIGALEEGTTYTLVADGSHTDFYPSTGKLVQTGDTGVVLTLSDEVAIRGKVLWENKSKEGLNIYLYKANEEPVSSVKTDVFGEFVFANLDNGKYKLVIETSNQPFVKEITYNGTLIDLGSINLK